MLEPKRRRADPGTLGKSRHYTSETRSRVHRSYLIMIGFLSIAIAVDLFYHFRGFGSPGYASV